MDWETRRGKPVKAEPTSAMSRMGVRSLILISVSLYWCFCSPNDARSQSTPFFKGEIPTKANPIRGDARLARMRREGRLPDSFDRGGCRYDPAGDPAVAYYLSSCAKRR